MSIIYVNPFQFATPTGPTDPNFANVSLLLHGDGSNGSTTIVDSSSNGNIVTANRDARISTTQSKFGGSSIEFPNSAISGLSVNSPGSIFQVGTGDWTVEAWIFQRVQAQYTCLVEIGNHAQSDSFIIITGTDGFSIYSGAFFGPRTNAFTLNTWQHVAVTSSGNTLYFFLDETIVGSSSGYSFTNNLSNFSTVSVGYPYGLDSSGTNSSYTSNGYIDDLRITKGVARYETGTGANVGKMVFAGTNTLALPTAPFPDS